MPRVRISSLWVQGWNSLVQEAKGGSQLTPAPRTLQVGGQTQLLWVVRRAFPRASLCASGLGSERRWGLTRECNEELGAWLGGRALRRMLKTLGSVPSSATISKSGQTCIAGSTRKVALLWNALYLPWFLWLRFLTAEVLLQAALNFVPLFSR